MNAEEILNPRITCEEAFSNRIPITLEYIEMYRELAARHGRSGVVELLDPLQWREW